MHLPVVNIRTVAKPGGYPSREIMPSRPVRVVTQGPSEPVRVVTNGPSDPVRVVSGYPSDPVRVVTGGPSDPVRVVSGSLTPVVSDPIGDGLRSDAVAYYSLSSNVNDSTPNHLDFTVIDPVSFVGGWCIFGAGGPPGSNLVCYNAALFNFGDVDFALAYEFMRSTVTDGITVTCFSTGPNPFEVDVEYSPVQLYVFFEKQSDGGGNNADTATLPDPMALNTPHLVIAWYTASDQTVHISLDNLADHPVAFSSPATITPGTVELDVGGGNNFYFRRLGIWGRVLTSDERTYLWNSGAGRALFP